MPIYQPDQIILNRKYKVERQIGVGAFGEVYLVTHLDLGVQRAVKVVHRAMPGFGSTRFEEAFDRFRQEAQIGARLKNENLIQVHDFEDGDVSLHLVMEYAAGGSLEEKIQKKQAQGELFSVKETCEIMKDIAAGLIVLHDKRNPIVHRDLKPSNILFDENGKAKISDLGLAQVPGGLSQRSRLGSVTTSHPGTPMYMSPEQENTTAILRPSSDVYSLGLILFELLTGVNYKMQRPDIKVSSFLKEVPGQLDSLISSMLADDPSLRPWDGGEVLEAIKQLGHPKTKSPTSQNNHPIEKSNKKVKPWMWGLISVVMIVIVFIWMVFNGKFSPSISDQERTLTQIDLSNAPLILPTVADFVHNDVKEMEQSSTVLFSEEPSSIEKKTPSPTLELRDPIISQKDGMKMLYIPAGYFIMGSEDQYASSDEAPEHTVYLDAFWIDQFEVSNQQFSAFVNDTGYRTSAEKDGCSYVDSECVSGLNWRKPFDSINSIDAIMDYPVVHISWFDASAYCEWAGKRLPTEAEWEKAARGENGIRFPWGDEWPNGDLVNFCDVNCEKTKIRNVNYDDGFKYLAPVNSFENGMSPYGVINMAGNALEWVFDMYLDNYYSTQSSWINPIGPSKSEYRGIRGGSWSLAPENLRSSFRGGVYPEFANGARGIRCVMDAK